MSLVSADERLARAALSVVAEPGDPVLTGPDSLYRLAAEVLAVNGHRRLDEALRWRSDPNPRVGRRPLPATM